MGARCSPAIIATTFAGLYFPDADHAFLDAAWSHVDELEGATKALALSYHFLDGLATFWRGQEIMWEAETRELRKRETPFGSKRTVRVALDRLFDHFSAPQTLLVPYGSNADPDAAELEALLARRRRSVRRIEIPRSYAFGTHRAATRRAATEYVFVAS